MESSDGSYATTFVENYFACFYSMVDEANVFSPQGGENGADELVNETTMLYTQEIQQTDFESYNEIVNNCDENLGHLPHSYENFDPFVIEMEIYKTYHCFPKKVIISNGKPITYSV